MERAALCSLHQQLLCVVLERLCPALDWHVTSDSVLVVGCGSGDVIAHVLLPRLPPGLRVVSAGRSHATVAQAAATVAEAAGPRLTFLPLHIGTRRIHSTAVWRFGPYSKVFSFFSLQWEQRPRRAIKNISKLLCTGGETVLVLMSRTGLFETFMNLANSAKWRAYFKDCQQLLSPYCFSDNQQDELNSYLEEAGLTVKTCYEQEIMYVTTEELRAKEMMMALNPFVGMLPQDMRAVFQRESEQVALQSGAVIASTSKDVTLYSTGRTRGSMVTTLLASDCALEIGEYISSRYYFTSHIVLISSLRIESRYMRASGKDGYIMKNAQITEEYRISKRKCKINLRI